MTRRGITLVEVIVVALISAGIAAGTVSAVSQSLRARESSQARYEAFVTADIAARSIAKDIANIVRDGDLFYTRFLLEDEGQGDREEDRVLMFSRSSSRARAGEAPEGAEYEIQYRAVDPAKNRLVSKDTPGLDLWKRTDPVPDEVPEGGGVAYPITSSILSLSILAYDGEGWYEEWDSDIDGYPHAVSVTVRTTSDNERRTATARRIVPIDRPPVPYTSVGSPPDEGGSDSDGGGR